MGSLYSTAVALSLTVLALDNFSGSFAKKYVNKFHAAKTIINRLEMVFLELNVLNAPQGILMDSQS